ncbi:MAG: hypothetical protein H0V71_03695 [Chloroflexi bacterium]|nr:hypothetical protein [Chloroflexota bacterium]
MGNVTVTKKKGTGITPTGQSMIADIALSSSYATGGDSVTLASIGMRVVNAIICNAATTPGGHAVEVIHGTDGAVPLLRVRDVATGVEIAATTSLSAQSVRAIVIGDLSNI